MVIIILNFLMAHGPTVAFCFLVFWLYTTRQSFNHRLDMIKKEIDQSRENTCVVVNISISAVSRIESDMEEIRSEIKKMKEMQS